MGETKTVVITDDLRRSMVRSFSRLLLTRQPTLTLLIVSPLVALAYVLTVPGFPWIGVPLVLMPLVLTYSLRRLARKGIGQTMPTGSTAGFGIDDEGVFVSCALGSGLSNWSAFDQLRLRGDVAALRCSNRAYQVVPRTLLTDEDIDLAGRHVRVFRN